MSAVHFPRNRWVRRSGIRRSISLGGLLALLGGGCAAVLGVEEASCDPDFDDACSGETKDTADTSGDATSSETTAASSSSGNSSDAPPPEELVTEACEDYCADVLLACVDEAPQFTTESGCMTICENMFRFDDSAEGLTGNTIQCRAESARTALDFRDGREQTCVSAGPMGPGCGGTACDNYCDAMERFCPEEFESIPDCDELCRTLPRSEPYTDDFPNSNTLECRVYHIQLSVRSSPQRLVHCGHAAGKGDVCVD